MGRLFDKLSGRKRKDEKQEYYQQEGGEEYPPEEYYDEYQQPQQPQQPYPQQIDPRLLEEYRRQYEEECERPLERKEKDARAPLAILDEIKDRPSYNGTFKTKIQGKPVDLHSLENYVLKISPYVLRTLLRYRTIRTMEEARNVAGRRPVKMNSKMLILIILAVGMALLGIVMIFFLPDIMNMFKAGI